MICVMSYPHLSAAQIRFAHEHHAHAGGHAASDDRLVFMYRRDDAGTRRWLVGEMGQVFDSAWFAERSPVAA